MLGIMRKYKQSIIIRLVFGLIAFSFLGYIFLIWGKGGDKGGGGSNYAARVDNIRIPFDEFQKSLYRMRNMYMQIYGRSVTPEMEKQLGMKKLALDSLIDNALLRHAAEEMGIKVTKDDVTKEIAQIPVFQKNGAFDFDLYQQILRSERMTPANFEESVKEELLIQKVRQKIREKAVVSDDEALRTFGKQNDKVDLLYAHFTPVEMKKEVKLTDQDLNTYVQAYQEQFKTPEEISLSYLVVDPDKMAGKVSVTDDEVQAFYNKHIDRFPAKDGFLPFSQVKESAKAMTLHAKAAQEAYGMVADALNKNMKAADINAAAASLGVKVNETPLFTMTAPAAQLAGETTVLQRSFALRTGELGGPVETTKGIYLIKVKDRQPAAVPPLAVIRAKVEPLAAAEKARQLAQKKATDEAALLTGGKSQLKMEETGEFAYTPKGEVPKIGVAPEIMTAAYNLTAASPVAKNPFQVGDGWYVIKLKNRVEMNRSEFPKQKEQIKQALLPQKQQEVLQKWMQDARSKAKIEINPALQNSD